MEFPPLVGHVLRRRVRRLRVEPHTASVETPGIRDDLSIDRQMVISRCVPSGRFEPPGVVLRVHIDHFPSVHLRASIMPAQVAASWYIVRTRTLHHASTAPVNEVGEALASPGYGSVYMNRGLGFQLSR